MSLAEGSLSADQTIAETYRVIREIGAGGMGTIYEAEHLRVGRKFALKLLSMDLAANEEVFQRFKREAEIAGRLGHPNIVEVVDFNRAENGQPYIVMEMLKGEDLADKIARDGAYTLKQAHPIIAEMVDALEAAHAAGVVHRDLKPQNIFLCARGRRTDFVKLLDFGISKMKQSDSVVTKTNAVMGTPYYMSPEQAEGRNKDVDARTDIFALGAIIYEMLTGRLAFYAPSVPTAMFKVCYEEPVPIDEILPGLPEGFKDVLDKALKKDKEERYASAAMFWEDFDRVYQGQSAKLETGIAHAVLFKDEDHDQPPRPAAATKATTLSGSASQLLAEPVVKRKSNAAVIILAVVGILALIGAGIFAAMIIGKKDKKPKPKPKVAAPPSMTPDPPMPGPMLTPSKNVRIALYVTPKTAEVFVGDKKVTAGQGNTKRVIMLPRGEEPVIVKVQAKGFSTDEVRVIPVTDQRKVISLLKPGQVRPAMRGRRRRRSTMRRGSVTEPPMVIKVDRARPRPMKRPMARPMRTGGAAADDL